MSRSRAVRVQRRNQGSDLARRVLAAIPAVAFAIFIITAGDWVFALGVLALAYVCLHELFRMYEGVRPVKLAGFLGVTALALAAEMGGERQVLLVGMACIPAVFLLGLAMPEREGDRLTAGMMVTFLGLFWIGMAVAHAILLEQVVGPGDARHGGAIIIDILVGTFIGDTAAYLGGRWFGRRRLAPRVSPNKTVEGLLVGMVAAIVATWCAGLYQDWLSGTDALLLGLAVAIAAPVGDLFESKVKRDAGTKDAGTLFGAHGGALDRLDAAFFALVAGYYVWLGLM